MAAYRELAALPKDPVAARELWTRAMYESLERAQPLGGLPPHGRPFAGEPLGTPLEQQLFGASRANFLALIFCLVVGTAGLPHLLTRFYTTPSVADARSSVGWALFFIWAGTALLTGIGWTWALIGTAVIILGVQAILLLRGEPMDAFMVAVGIVLLGGAIADLGGIAWSFIPVALIVIGVGMLAGTLRAWGQDARPEP